jgi:glucose-6-phosphate isomerase
MNNINHLSIIDATNTIDYGNGQISGNAVQNYTKYLRDLQHTFEDEEAFSNSDSNKVIYLVQAIFPIKEGTEGGLFYGRTIIYPGKIGNEYYMTKGHFHEKADRGEFYWGIKGEGMLLLMDKKRNTWAEKIYPGSLHYINGYTAHRTVNTGNSVLSFGACWPSDAGHNYQEIMDNGFSARIKEIDGKPQLISTK